MKNVQVEMPSSIAFLYIFQLITTKDIQEIASKIRIVKLINNNYDNFLNELILAELM